MESKKEQEFERNETMKILLEPQNLFLCIFYSGKIVYNILLVSGMLLNNIGLNCAGLPICDLSKKNTVYNTCNVPMNTCQLIFLYYC